jgi:hypothetical protein
MLNVESYREPVAVAAGDTLQWVRRLPAFPSGQGWAITYEIRGGAQPIQFVSTPDVDGISHDIYVPPATTAGWLAGQLLMEGYVGNGVDRQVCYYGELTVKANLEGANANIPVKTFKQQQLERMEVCLQNFSTSGLLETRIGETMFRYATVKDLYWAYGMAYSQRKNEISMERAQNGQDPGNKIQPRANTTQTGPAAGQVIYPYGWGAS